MRQRRQQATGEASALEEGWRRHWGLAVQLGRGWVVLARQYQGPGVRREWAMLEGRGGPSAFIWPCCHAGARARPVADPVALPSRKLGGTVSGLDRYVDAQAGIGARVGQARDAMGAKESRLACKVAIELLEFAQTDSNTAKWCKRPVGGLEVSSRAAHSPGSVLGFASKPNDRGNMREVDEKQHLARCPFSGIQSSWHRLGRVDGA